MHMCDEDFRRHCRKVDFLPQFFLITQIPYREPIRMVWGDCCEIQMWQHKAAELLYESLHLEPASSIQIGRYHVNQACEQRFEHELQKTSLTYV